MRTKRYAQRIVEEARKSGYTVAVITLHTELSKIPGVGQRFLKHLTRMGIKTVGGLLHHFPFRYEDYSRIYKVGDLEPGQHATVQAEVREVAMRRSWRKNMAIVEALLGDDTGTIRAVWFNQPFVRNVVAPGRTVNLSGKVSANENELYFSSPTYEAIRYNEPRHTARLVPIYPETRGLTSKGIRFLMSPILKNLAPLAEWIPKEILSHEQLPEVNAALASIHFPETIEDALAAKKRFAFEDLFLLQLANVRQKSKLAREKAPPIKTDIDELKKVLALLPFELTASQKRSLWEVIQDIEKTTPMNRLLQGDVGSGKTIVAALAALSATRAGYQAAFMAPTEVLARQHFETMKHVMKYVESGLPESCPALALLTGSDAKIFFGDKLESKIRKQDIADKIKRNEVQLVIGTHALIEDSVSFHNLGLVVVDEQHRFGVEQRAALIGGARATLPHFLSMSATPIPRTLMLTIFGDLDVSTIDELPQGRKAIVTRIVNPEHRSKAYDFLRAQVQLGRQIFVICPRIEPSEEEPHTHALQKNLELKSVKEEFEKLSSRVFPDLKITMLHGQMRPKEKERVMAAFKANEYDILVSTSVVEVGVDIPNASVMMIEGADRFGLAQLYQFRGRVGRGEHQSYCLLFTDSSSKTTSERLKAIVAAKNGFELAEKDLEIRGPGQFLGTEQTGLPDLAMRGLQDIELIKASRAAARIVLSKDPGLTKSKQLKAKLLEFEARIHKE